MEEPAFLMAVQRIIGGVQVEHDLTRRLAVRVEKQVDEQRLDSRAVVADLVIAPGRPLGRGVLQPVQRALAGQRRRCLGRTIELTEKHAKNGITPQLVRSTGPHSPAPDRIPLRDQRLHFVHHVSGMASIAKAGCKAVDEPDGLVRLPEQESAHIRGDHAAVEIRDHTASARSS